LVVAIQHRPMRLAVGRTLERLGVGVVVAAVDTAAAAVRAARCARPDVVLLDITLLERRFERPLGELSRTLNGAPLVLVGVENGNGFERGATLAGASAYLPLDGPIDDLARAVGQAAASRRLAATA
jgi:DNA-binding NarL/FixJ family response regulator